MKDFSPTMRVKDVVELIVKPATEVERVSFIDLMSPGLYVKPTAFVSHAFGNPFHLLVKSLLSHFRDAVPSEVFVWIDVFIINQHDPGADLHGGQTLKATIEASPSVVVVLDREALPLKRLWCLYEIGSSSPEKLILLTHGFDESQLGAAFSKIDANEAKCFYPSDTTRIRAHVRQMMVEHKTVFEDADETTALTAFSGLLKLLLILKRLIEAAMRKTWPRCWLELLEMRNIP